MALFRPKGVTSMSSPHNQAHNLIDHEAKPMGDSREKSDLQAKTARLQETLEIASLQFNRVVRR